MSDMLDANIQRKQWLKLALFAAIVLAVITFAGISIRNGNGLPLAMGTDRMSNNEKDSLKEHEGVLDIQHWVTDDGVRVYYVQAQELPMVDVDVVFDAGSARDGEKSGVAFLANDMLSEGTAEMNADKLAESMEFLGAQLNYQAQRDMASVHLRSLSDTEILSEGVKLLGEILAKPAYPEKAFKREQQNALKLLDHEAQSPRTIAQKAFYETLYAQQPYANWPHGTKESIQALTPADLVAFHKLYYTKQNVIVTIVGDVDIEGANAIASVLTQNLPEGKRAEPLPQVQDLEKAPAKKVTFPSEQTHIIMGAPTLTRMDKDYYPLYVGNHILGGNGTVTRLFHAIRHDKGLAYDVHSYFRPMREKGPFVVGCQTKRESAEEALTIMKETVRAFVKEGPSEQELDDAKQNLLGGFPLRLDSNRAIASHVTVIAFYDLPLDYFDQYKKGIEQVDLDAIKDAYQRRIDVDNMAVIMVGEA